MMKQNRLDGDSGYQRHNHSDDEEDVDRNIVNRSKSITNVDAKTNLRKGSSGSGSSSSSGSNNNFKPKEVADHSATNSNSHSIINNRYDSDSDDGEKTYVGNYRNRDTIPTAVTVNSGNEFGKENEPYLRTGPSVRSRKEGWNAAKPAGMKAPVPKGPAPYIKAPTGSRATSTTANSSHSDDDDDDDDEVVKNPRQRPNSNRDVGVTDNNDTPPSIFNMLTAADNDTNKEFNSFTEYVDNAAANGVVLPRKSGYYDDDSVDANVTNYNNLMSNANNIPFVTRAIEKGLRTDLIQCTIIRDRGTIESTLYPTYELIMESNKKCILLARKMNFNSTSNYHLFDMSRGAASNKLTKKSGNYLGKLRSKSSSRTSYVLLTKNTTETEEVAGIQFDRLGIFDQFKEGSQPRKMTVLLPKLDDESVPIPHKVSESKDNASLSEMIEAGDIDKDMYLFESKDPSYENGNYRLNFHGRVSVPSVKNFQLVSKDDTENIVCQFGKVGSDRFHLDYKAPLTGFQAFALALCQFNL